MQFKTIAISAFVGLAAATSSTDVSDLVNDLPSCSLLCLVSGASEAGCGATDYTCQCKSESSITTNATSCLKSSCSATEIGSKCPYPPSRARVSLAKILLLLQLLTSSSHQERNFSDLRRHHWQQQHNLRQSVQLYSHHKQLLYHGFCFVHFQHRRL